MAHANARLTLHGRLLLVRRVVEEERPPAHVAKELGVSRKTVYGWVARYRAEGVEGVEGLKDRSSRPHRSPHRTPVEAEERVLEARRALRAGRDRIAHVTRVPARTVSRILTRNGVPRLAECDPLTGQVIRASKTTSVRYERSRPGELVHLDVKKIGRIPEGGGWRALGRAVGSTARDRSGRVGFDYVHVAVDDHSRLSYAEVLADEKGPTCAAFLERAAAWFAAHGIARIERIMTDNAWAYRYSLRDVAARLGARQIFIKPHCPWQNGKAERFIRTLQTEWAYRQPYASNADRTTALAPWLQHYNHHRTHTALGGHPPISRVLSPT
jgi:transposase InsO family protein